jgi:HK97 family phage major capsid protein
MTLEKLSTEVMAMEEGLKSFQRRHQNRLEKLEEKVSGSPLYRKHITAAQRPEKTLKAELCRGTAVHAFESYMRGHGGFEAKALSSGETPGSYLMPEVIQERVSNGLRSVASFRSLARQMSVSSGSVEVIVDRTLPAVGWVSEMAERPETEAGSLAKIKISLQELYAKPKATQKLLDDGAINIEDWLVSKVTEKMVRIENEAFLSGDGNGKPTGFLNYQTEDAASFGKLQHHKTGANGGFGGNGANTLFDMVASLKTEYLADAVWVMSRSAEAAVRKLKERGTGQYLWQPALGERLLPVLMGYPVHVMDEMPALVFGEVSCSIAFGSFKDGYQIVEKPQLNVLRDPYSAKPYVEFYITKRVGGDVIDFDAIKVLKFEGKEEEGEAEEG